jgi:thiol-disulfide isomerase/thioredoxin
MIKKLTLLTNLFLLFNFVAFSQQSQIGKTVSDLTFKEVLNDKTTSYKLSDFKGKIVLLDFWATWCAPCIKSFPTMDSLQKQFSNDLKVITITSSDDKTRITKFLEKFKTNLPIVLDSDNSLSKVFPHRTIPHTILIDKEGVIKSITLSSAINKSVIQKILNGENLSMEEKNDDLDFDPDNFSLSAMPDVLGQITLTPFRKDIPSLSTSFKQGRISFINMLPSTIYETLYDYPHVVRSIWETSKTRGEWKEENLYCLEMIAPNQTKQQAKQTLINYLQASIPLKAKVEAREKQVKILKSVAKTNLLATAKADETSYTMQKGGFEMKNTVLAPFVTYLEEQLNIPIIDETGLLEKYNLKVKWYTENPQQIFEELKKLGLTLEDGKRTINMLVFYE